mmetsp:Transcript_11520/g.32640  ORF Transcript_11520/g.32640 Transcript_11520/m.32640 type:complete len:200 (-) Transcript_11520:773-1372(-)
MGMDDHGGGRPEPGGLIGEEADAIGRVDKAKVEGRVMVVLRRGGRRGAPAHAIGSRCPTAAFGSGLPPTLATAAGSEGLEFGPYMYLCIQALARSEVIELHVGNGVVDTGHVGRVAYRALDAIPLGEVGTVDASDANLSEDDAIFAARCRCRNVSGRGGEYLDVPTDEAVDGVEDLLVFRGGEEEGLAAGDTIVVIGRR